MTRNPGGMSVVQLAALGVGAWFLFRTPTGGGPSLFSSLIGHVTGSTPSTGVQGYGALRIVRAGHGG